MRAPIYICVTDTAESPARTGIQTAVRGIVAGMAQAGAAFHLSAWSFWRHALVPLRPRKSLHLGGYHEPEGRWLSPRFLVDRAGRHAWTKARGHNYRVPLHEHPGHRRNLGRGWLLLPELMEAANAREIIDYARRHGLAIAAIFHDAIAITHPHLVGAGFTERHRGYMDALADVDVVLAVSAQAAAEYQQFVAGRTRFATVHVCPEAAEILGVPRVTTGTEPRREGLRILCVSTLEPRKNHAVLLQAFTDAAAAHPALKIQLDLVGDVYKGADEITRMVSAAAAIDPAIRWLGRLPDDELRRLYTECDFTVYPSVVEGFGLPIVESLWSGKACICANFGVMAENAAGGGCLTVDVRDRSALRDAITALAVDLELRRRLTAEAMTRPLKTWRDYAEAIGNVLAVSEAPPVAR